MLKSLVFVKNVRFLGFTLVARVGQCMLSLIHGPDPCIYTNPTQLYTTTDIQIQCSINQFGVILSVQKKQRRRFRQIEIENTQYCCFLRAPQPRRRAQTYSLTHTHRTTPPLSTPFRYTGVAAYCRSSLPAADILSRSLPIQLLPSLPPSSFAVVSRRQPHKVRN